MFISAANGGANPPTGRVSADNVITDIDVVGNVIDRIGRSGVILTAGGVAGTSELPSSRNRIERATIRNNSVTSIGSDLTGAAGIRVYGGAGGPTSQNVVAGITIADNRVSATADNGATAIEVSGGWAPTTAAASRNEVRDVMIRGNAIQGLAKAISLFGGKGATATDNLLERYAIEGNRIGAGTVRIADNEEGGQGNVIRR